MQPGDSIFEISSRFPGEVSDGGSRIRTIRTMDDQENATNEESHVATG